MSPAKPSFHEVQTFSQVWLWVLVLLVSPLGIGGAVVLILSSYGVFSSPEPDLSMAGLNPIVAWLLAVPLVAFSVALPILFLKLQLTTDVRDDGLHVRFRPFIKRHIAFSDIRECAARHYSAITEFGGWGARWRPATVAFTISGNRGVQLVLHSHRRVLIGSQHADELASAIQAHLATAET